MAIRSHFKISSPPRHKGTKGYENEDFDLKMKRFSWSLGALVVKIVLCFGF
jgi:hypothetical protein